MWFLMMLLSVVLSVWYNGALRTCARRLAEFLYMIEFVCLVFEAWDSVKHDEAVTATTVSLPVCIRQVISRQRGIVVIKS